MTRAQAKRDAAHAVGALFATALALWTWKAAAVYVGIAFVYAAYSWKAAR